MDRYFCNTRYYYRRDLLSREQSTCKESENYFPCNFKSILCSCCWNTFSSTHPLLSVLFNVSLVLKRCRNTLNKGLDERTRYPLFYIGWLLNRRRNHGDPATAAAAGGLHDDTGGLPPTRSTRAINYERRKPAPGCEASVAHFTRALRTTSLYRPPEQFLTTLSYS